MIQEKSNSKKAEIKKLLKSWSDKTSMHGISNIAESKSWLRRTIWILAFLVCTTYCLYSMIDSFLLFMQELTTTNVQNIRQNEHEFPAVTICNLNPFNTANNETKTFIEDILRENGYSLSVDNDSTAHETMSDIIALFKAGIAYQYSKKNISFETIKNMSFSLDQLLVSCSFKGSTCDAKNFTHFFSYEYGNCYIFNARASDENEQKDALRIHTGQMYSLKLELFSGYPLLQDQLSIQKGFFVSISNRSTNQSANYGGSYVQTGASTNIGITKSIYQKLSTRNARCRNNLEATSSDSVYYKLAANVAEYRQDICRDMFIVLKVVAKLCKCLDGQKFDFLDLEQISMEYNLSVCHTMSQIDCIKNIYSNDRTKGIPYELCPLECSSSFYSTSINSAAYPSASYSNMLAKQKSALDKVSATNSSIPDFGETFAMISIYYENPWYSMIESSLQMSSSTLVGLIGGFLGLCVGMSFMSILDLWDLLVDLLKVCLKRKGPVKPYKIDKTQKRSASR